MKQLSGKRKQVDVLEQQLLQTQQKLQQTQEKLQLTQQQVRRNYTRVLDIWIITASVSLQSAENKGKMVDLQYQLQETRTERAQLYGECRNRTCAKLKIDSIVGLQMN